MVTSITTVFSTPRHAILTVYIPGEIGALVACFKYAQVDVGGRWVSVDAGCNVVIVLLAALACVSLPPHRYIIGNDLTSLPLDIFEGLTNLKQL